MLLGYQGPLALKQELWRINCSYRIQVHGDVRSVTDDRVMAGDPHAGVWGVTKVRWVDLLGAILLPLQSPRYRYSRFPRTHRVAMASGLRYRCWHVDQITNAD
jgi:hypothetical protein